MRNDSGLEMFVSFVFVVFVLIGTYAFAKTSCEERSISFSDSKFGIFTGCMVNHHGKWLPLDNIRGFDGRG